MTTTPNEYFRALPEDMQQALGKAAYSAYLYADPPFQFTGKWEGMKPDMQARWLVVVECIMNALQENHETVTGKMETFNELQRVLNDATERFEGIRPQDSFFNNYQLYETLRSALAEVDNARLLMLRANNEQGNVNYSGDENTANVRIPNVHKGE